MLELKTKWMTNTLAKESMLKNDFILCHNGTRLFIVGYGVLTNSGKNTYNIMLKDSEDKVLEEHSNLYLDAITKLILGSSPKSKANKDNESKDNESKDNESKPKSKASKQGANESLLLTFDNAFNIACKKIESYKDVAKVLGKYDTKDACVLALHLIKEANESETKRIKEAKKQSELTSLYQTLEIAKTQGNAMLIDAISEMIANKEKE